MSDTIKKIWQDKIFPNTEYCVNENEIMELHKKNSNAEETIISALPLDKKRIFENLIDSYMTLIDLLNEDSFTKGFKLGARIIKDALE